MGDTAETDTFEPGTSAVASKPTPAPIKPPQEDVTVGSSKSERKSALRQARLAYMQKAKGGQGASSNQQSTPVDAGAASDDDDTDAVVSQSTNEAWMSQSGTGTHACDDGDDLVVEDFTGGVPKYHRKTTPRVVSKKHLAAMGGRPEGADDPSDTGLMAELLSQPMSETL